MSIRISLALKSRATIARVGGGFLAVVLLGFGLLVGPAPSAAAATSTVSNAAEIASAFANAVSGDTVQLLGDITSTSAEIAIAVPAGRSITLDLAGHALTATRVGGSEPGIGVPVGATLIIEDSSNSTGTLVVTGGSYSAGIGAGNAGSSGDLTVNGGTITATGHVYAAGIGGGSGGNGGVLTVNGGIVTANASDFGAAIGGGNWGNGGAVTINGGVVTANGGKQSAGIGGGQGGDGGTLSINAGTVTASGGEPASGIIAVAIGGSNPTMAFGALSNSGSLTIPAGSGITIPAGVIVTNTGTITLAGTIINNGSITGTGTINPASSVTVNNYSVLADPNDGASVTTATRVLAATLADASLSLPTAPARAGYAFAGWFDAPTGGAMMTTNTPLGTGAGPSWPVSVTLYAQWTSSPSSSGVAELANSGTDGIPLSLGGSGAVLLGLALVLLGRRTRIVTGIPK